MDEGTQPKEQPPTPQQHLQPQMQTCQVCSTTYPATLPACPTCTLQALMNQSNATQKVNAALAQLRAALAEARATKQAPVSPPIPPSPPMQQTFRGRGQKVTDPFVLNPGLSRFQFDHNGRRNFIVWLIDASGNRVALLVNASGRFNGSNALGIKFRGQYLLNVQADGNWMVHVQQP